MIFLSFDDSKLRTDSRGVRNSGQRIKREDDTEFSNTVSYFYKYDLNTCKFFSISVRFYIVLNCLNACKIFSPKTGKLFSSVSCLEIILSDIFS